MVRGHHVYSYAQGPSVSDNYHGLVQQKGIVLHGCGFLRLGPGRGLGEIQQARYLQQRLRLSVYQFRFYQRLARQRHPHFYG